LEYDNASSDGVTGSLLIQSRSTQTLKTGKILALNIEAASSSKVLVTTNFDRSYPRKSESSKQKVV
jgi:hypothetical protein